MRRSCGWRSIWRNSLVMNDCSNILVANVTSVLSYCIVMSVVVVQERLEIVNWSRMLSTSHTRRLGGVIVVLMLDSWNWLLMRHIGIESIIKEAICWVINSCCGVYLTHDVLQASRRIPHAVDRLRLADVDVDLVTWPVLLMDSELLEQLCFQIIFVRLVFGIFNCTVGCFNLKLCSLIVLLLKALVCFYKCLKCVHFAWFSDCTASVDTFILSTIAAW